MNHFLKGETPKSWKLYAIKTRKPKEHLKMKKLFRICKVLDKLASIILKKNLKSQSELIRILMNLRLKNLFKNGPLYQRKDIEIQSLPSKTGWVLVKERKIRQKKCQIVWELKELFSTVQKIQNVYLIYQLLRVKRWWWSHQSWRIVSHRLHHGKLRKRGYIDIFLLY